MYQPSGRTVPETHVLLEQLHVATSGRLNIFDEPLIQRMGRYIMDVNISGDWFVDFADAYARFHGWTSVALRYGLAVRDEQLTDFARNRLDFVRELDMTDWYEIERILTYLFRRLEDIFVRTEDLPLFTVYPDTQVITARQTGDRNTGLFIGLKGGHNEEYHNHNDVGHFVLYLNGLPVIIDSGAMTYETGTFGPERYNIWVNQSSFYTLPEINGVMQKNGTEYGCSCFEYTDTAQELTVDMEIGNAWPEEAGVAGWKRTFIFNREAGSMILNEEAAFSRDSNRIVLNFLLAEKPEIKEDCILIHSSAGQTLKMGYDTELFSPEAESIMISDSWLVFESCGSSQHWTIQFSNERFKHS